MARKKTERPEMTATEAKSKLRLVRLELPEEYHDATWDAPVRVMQTHFMA